MGGTAGIFVKQGESFLRISTNLLGFDGSRAVGRVLDANDAAFAAIRRGESYFGVAEILGQPYITGYEPIRQLQRRDDWCLLCWIPPRISLGD